MLRQIAQRWIKPIMVTSNQFMGRRQKLGADYKTDFSPKKQMKLSPIKNPILISKHTSDYMNKILART